MKIIKKISRDFGMKGMAGLGMAAWNNGSAPLEVSVQKHRRECHTVKVDHEERVRDATKRSRIYLRRFSFLDEGSDA